MALVGKKPRPVKNIFSLLEHNQEQISGMSSLSQTMECHCISCVSMLCYIDNTPNILTWSAPFIVVPLKLR